MERAAPSFQDAVQYVQDFRWKSGETRMSHWSVLGGAWLIYWTCLFVIPRMNLGKIYNKYVAAAHNVFLCVWSLGMFLGTCYGIYERYPSVGYKSLFCYKKPEEAVGILPFMLYSYYISKYYELFDTLINLLRGKPIMFLHWYHHSIVIAMTWSWLEYDFGFGNGGMLVNTFVHVVMYYYYGATTLGHKVWFKKYITVLQIVQFLLSFFMTVHYVQLASSGQCISSATSPELLFSLGCNISFFLLFLQFYRKSYTSSSKKTLQKEA